jgi:Uma2 family endonuclease
MSALTTPPAPTGATTPPPAAVWPRPLRWTVALFHRVNSTGAFEGRRPILIRGVLLEQGPMEPPHGNGVERVDAQVRLAFGTGWRFRIQLPLVLNLQTDPMPDVAVVPGPLVGSPAHPSTAALVVEVSDTSLAFDLSEKAELYATAGVADYWVLDLNGRVLHVLRDPHPLPANLGATAYRTHTTLGPADAVSPLAAPTSTIRVADLLP